jgi:hypothetical protein
MIQCGDIRLVVQYIDNYSYVLLTSLVAIAFDDIYAERDSHWRRIAIKHQNIQLDASNFSNADNLAK